MTEKKSKGSLFVISAPSGAGKTTLVRRAIAERPDIRFSISHTTRPQRIGEENGEDYFFVEEDEFRQMQQDDKFLEHAAVFGNLYGTGRDQVESVRDAGHDVLLEIDWQGARQVRSNEPDCCSIFIMPPSVKELERRLRGRRTDTDAVIRRRLQEALDDVSHWTEFDHVVINDDLDEATNELLAVLAGSATATRTSDPDARSRVAQILD